MLNAAYAYLVEKTNADDAAAVPAYRVAGVESKEIIADLEREKLDAWLDAPYGQQAENEKALIAYLTS